MEIADLLSPRGVIAQLRAGNKKQALQEIARRAAAATGVAERRIYDVLAERERLAQHRHRQGDRHSARQTA